MSVVLLSAVLIFISLAVCHQLCLLLCACPLSVALRTSFDLTTYKNREEAGHGSHLELSVIAHTLHFHMMPLQNENLFV